MNTRGNIWKTNVSRSKKDKSVLTPTKRYGAFGVKAARCCWFVVQRRGKLNKVTQTDRKSTNLKSNLLALSRG